MRQALVAPADWSAVAVAVLVIGLGSCTTSSAGGGSRAKEPAPTVLFVCEHGTVKSLLAKLLLEREAAKAGVSVRADSRGIDPDPAVPEWIDSALRRDGFQLGDWRPTGLTDADLRAADWIVSFDVSLPSASGVGEHWERWDGLPAVSEDYAAGREAIAARVAALVQRLKSPAPASSRGSEYP